MPKKQRTGLLARPFDVRAERIAGMTLEKATLSNVWRLQRKWQIAVRGANESFLPALYMYCVRLERSLVPKG